MTVVERKIPIKTSNLHAAVKQLDGNSYRIDPKQDEEVSSRAFNIVRVAETLGGSPANGEQVTVDQIADQFRSTDTLIDQSHELVGHLQTKERELAQQDADHQVRVWNWEQHVGRREKSLERRRDNLDDEEIQLRNLQFELLQLQNELIESQLATREIVNGLRAPGFEQDALAKLQFEFNQRFDHVMTTWRQFADDMKNLVERVEDSSNVNAKVGI